MTTPMDPVLKARARLGTATRYGTPEDQAAARQDMAAAKLERAITDALTAGLRPEHRRDLMQLLKRGA